METYVIKVLKKKSVFVKLLLKELGVKFIEKASKSAADPNILTTKTISNARNGIGLGEPIGDITAFIKSL